MYVLWDIAIVSEYKKSSEGNIIHVLLFAHVR